MYAYTGYGLGQTEDTSFLGGSFLGGSMLTSLVMGIGVIILFKYLTSEKQVRRHSAKHDRSGRKDYVSYVAKKHKLSRADQQYLMEHEE